MTFFRALASNVLTSFFVDSGRLFLGLIVTVPVTAAVTTALFGSDYVSVGMAFYVAVSSTTIALGAYRTVVDLCNTAKVDDVFYPVGVWRQTPWLLRVLHRRPKWRRYRTHMHTHDNEDGHWQYYDDIGRAKQILKDRFDHGRD